MYQIGGSNYKSDVPIFYVPPPGGVPNAFAAYQAAYTATSNPWKTAVFNARLAAMDPTAKVKALNDLARIEASYVEKMQGEQGHADKSNNDIAVASISAAASMYGAHQSALSAQDTHETTVPAEGKPFVEAINLSIDHALAAPTADEAKQELQAVRVSYANGLAAIPTRDGKVAYDDAVARAFKRVQDSTVQIEGVPIPTLAKAQLSGIQPQERPPTQFPGAPSAAQIAAQFSGAAPAHSSSSSTAIAAKGPVAATETQPLSAPDTALQTWKAAGEAIGQSLGRPPSQPPPPASPGDTASGAPRWDQTTDPLLAHFRQLEQQVSQAYDHPYGEMGDPIYSKTSLGPRRTGGVVEKAQEQGLAPDVTSGLGAEVEGQPPEPPPNAKPQPPKVKPHTFQPLPAGGPLAEPPTEEPVTDPFGHQFGGGSSLEQEIARRKAAWDRLRPALG